MRDVEDRSVETSWFRTRGGRRFGLEFALIIGIKFLLLIALWFIAFRPHPRPDTAPDAVERHLLAPATETAHDR